MGSLKGRNEAEPMNIQLVSGTYFPMLGVHAMVGRTLTDEDDQNEGWTPCSCSELFLVEQEHGARSFCLEQKVEDWVDNLYDCRRRSTRVLWDEGWRLTRYLGSFVMPTTTIGLMR